ncbi:MAG TPA: aminoacyl-tRNA hydrolase [Candidatus Paceibacterota bacterium]|nr:aminoacyl-tRNA hydrolase [Candidatus Paceibacterota bacterium]
MNPLIDTRIFLRFIANSMYIFLGLGNKGEEYEKTRHNAGRIVLQEALKKTGSEWKMDKVLLSQKAKAEIGGKSVLFLLPETFMNVSGKTAGALKLSEKKASELVVLHDEVDMPLGSFKISFNRGSAGHKGVESVKRALKTEGFIRIRIGICPTTPGGKQKKPDHKKFLDFIVGDFKKEELEKLKKVSKEIFEAMEMIVTEGKEKAMNVFNAK